jgi:hypothetical protein
MIVFRNLNPIEINEGDGQIILEIDPTASGITEETVVEILTIDGSARSTPFNDDVPGIDFNPINNLTTTIDPNNPDSLTITIDIIDDAIAEVDEDFQVQVIARDDASLNGTATVTIQDDDRDDGNNDELPFLELNTATMAEGDFGENTTEELTVNLVDSNGELLIATTDITFAYSTIDVTAVAGIDYEFITTQLATIPQGQSSISIPVTTIGDNEVELDETFSVVLSEIDSELVQFGNGESELATEITIEDDDGDINEPDPDPDDIIGSTIFRFFDSAAGVHFYTASETERDDDWMSISGYKHGLNISNIF